jgi:hypothetical protein
LKEIATNLSKRGLRVNMAEAQDLGFAFWCHDGPEYDMAHDPEWWEGASMKSCEVMTLREFSSRLFESLINTDAP